MSPRKQERLFEKAYAKDLLAIAEGDLATAKALLGVANIRIENAFYLAQQAVEKALKAVLVEKAVAVPLVHDLGALLGKLPDDCDPPVGYELSELNQYATVRRYEAGSWQPTEAELKTALDKCDQLVDWAAKIIRSGCL